jgi:hypothetical protein
MQTAPCEALRRYERHQTASVGYNDTPIDFFIVIFTHKAWLSNFTAHETPFFNRRSVGASGLRKVRKNAARAVDLGAMRLTARARDGESATANQEWGGPDLHDSFETRANEPGSRLAQLKLKKNRPEGGFFQMLEYHRYCER